jgi:hypothetical protein
MNEKPLSASSSCIEETPISRTTPSTAAPASVSSSEKTPGTKRKRSG